MKERFFWIKSSYKLARDGSALLFTVLLLIQLMLCALVIQKKFFRSTDIVVERVRAVQQEVWLESWLAWSVALLKIQFDQWIGFLQEQPQKKFLCITPADKKNSSIEPVTCTFTLLGSDAIGILITTHKMMQGKYAYQLERSISKDEGTYFTIKRLAVS